MLEVVFSDSVKGSIKVAKNYDSKKMRTGTPAYIGEKPTRAQLEKMYEGKALGGSSQDAVCIGFALDIGDISGEPCGVERHGVYKKLFGMYGVDEGECLDYFNRLKKDIDKLISYAEEGKSIRIWYNNAPYSLAGFYYVCHLLRNIDCEIKSVCLPSVINESDNKLVNYIDWGEIRPGKFYEFLPYEKSLSQVEKKMYSSLWNELVDENAPLRAIVNGKLISVPEDFYDFIIINNIPEGDFRMARFIGTLLGHYRLGIGDSWYALRIEKMIKSGEIIVVDIKDESHPYSKVLRKAQK
ncbi:MAG: DUF1835 domain-containing protein [Firmicutes bacterium]|jgi:hypothetical protein|nr:DUF1835 domain-containing protein [Bacillota bacterium]